MMIFNEFIYERPNFLEVKNKIEHCMKRMDKCTDGQSLYKIFQEIDQLEKETESNETICSIRHSIDTKDPFYETENDYLNEWMPEIQNLFNDAYTKFVEHPCLPEIRFKIPETFFMAKAMDDKCFNEKILEELKEENRWMTMYQNTIASAQVPFRNGIYTLSELSKWMNDIDRTIRKEATLAYWNWFSDNESVLGDIFDHLVKVRTKMAKKMGYTDYVEFGYYRMHRFDYTWKDIESYRREILKDVVPVAEKLYGFQKRRLAVQDVYAWDEKIEFPDGNPVPKYNAQQMVERAKKMYHELDPDIGSFFDYLTENQLMDLVSKPNKASGGYCTYIPTYKAPFIFANFNGTSSDVDTLTHEAGHAYQVYKSQNIIPNTCIWPTYESCEIHSMSMEFLTYPWMPLFFDRDSDKFYYKHMADAIKFLPYGALIDHFQHVIYQNPEWNHTQRMHAYRKLEKMYLPYKNYDEIPILENGGWWLRQLHVFMDPFYYIDYTLAQVCAFQIFIRSEKNDPNVIRDYKHICEIGGTKTFTAILKEAGIRNPMETGCLHEVMLSISQWILQRT
ncbi:MAG: M3 family oligoendopeptidase [Erysipelotrichaceae bacterium]|nr:M3 family oligoendopeptidase [Erysipelotrichaceae bacterium]